MFTRAWKAILAIGCATLLIAPLVSRAVLPAEGGSAPARPGHPKQPPPHPSPEPGPSPRAPPELGWLDPYKAAIQDAADSARVNRAVLMALLNQEGSGRNRVDDLPGFRALEAAGKAGQTIGIGQLRPDLAQALAKKYYGKDLSLDGARAVLAFDDDATIYLAARNLEDLKARFHISDAQAFVAYAANDSLVRAWLAGRKKCPTLAPEAQCQNMWERQAAFQTQYAAALQSFDPKRRFATRHDPDPIRVPAPTPRPGPSPSPPK